MSLSDENLRQKMANDTSVAWTLSKALSGLVAEYRDGTIETDREILSAFAVEVAGIMTNPPVSEDRLRKRLEVFSGGVATAVATLQCGGVN